MNTYWNFNFSDFDLSDEDTCRATLRMFLQCNLVQQFHIPYDVRKITLLRDRIVNSLLHIMYSFIGIMSLDIEREEKLSTCKIP